MAAIAPIGFREGEVCHLSPCCSSFGMERLLALKGRYRSGTQPLPRFIPEQFPSLGIHKPRATPVLLRIDSRSSKAGTSGPLYGSPRSPREEVTPFHPSWTRLPPRETFGLELAAIRSRRLCFHTRRGQDSRAGPTSWLLHTDKPSGSPWVPHWSCRKMQTSARSTTFPSRARSLQDWHNVGKSLAVHLCPSPLMISSPGFSTEVSYSPIIACTAARFCLMEVSKPGFGAGSPINAAVPSKRYESCSPHFPALPSSLA